MLNDGSHWQEVFLYYFISKKNPFAVVNSLIIILLNTQNIFFIRRMGRKMEVSVFTPQKCQITWWKLYKKPCIIPVH